MSVGRTGYGGRSMSSGAAFHLSPAFPERAAWGTASKLRAWQQEALDRYLEASPRDFLAVATPGAGKTTYALRVATELLSAGVVQRITVVAPTEHLKTQWADAAARVGISLDPKFSNSVGRHSEDYHGVAVTYAQVASRPALHRELTTSRRTLVILDEVHHGGDAKSWGDGIREAFDPAERRLSLTGTPFRSDTSPIPFVTYELDAEGTLVSSSDYTYGYAEALRDGVVRPVLFMAYGGSMRWRTKAGDELEARLGEPMTKDVVAHAWRTALDPKGEWIPAVLTAADRRLSEVRRHVADAGGLVIASNQTQARAYAAILRQLTGEAPTVVLSDDLGASKRIEDFGASDERWMVAVRMVSEGVDVPRLAVGVYATSTSTPLFFAQAVGRFVRARRRGETASVFLPSVPVVLDHAVAARGAARPCPRPQAQPRRHRSDVGGGAGAHRRGQPRGQGWRGARRGRLRGPRVGRALRPRALRQAAVGDARADRLGGRGGVSRAARVCSSPTRSPCSCRSGRAARSRRRRRVPRLPCRSPPTGRSRPSARSSTRSSRPTRGRRACRTPTSTWT